MVTKIKKKNDLLHRTGEPFPKSVGRRLGGKKAAKEKLDRIGKMWNVSQEKGEGSFVCRNLICGKEKEKVGSQE